MLAFHDADTDTDTDYNHGYNLTSDTRKIVAVFGESVSVSVSVSASWNASLTTRRDIIVRAPERAAPRHLHLVLRHFQLHQLLMTTLL